MAKWVSARCQISRALVQGLYLMVSDTDVSDIKCWVSACPSNNVNRDIRAGTNSINDMISHNPST